MRNSLSINSVSLIRSLYYMMNRGLARVDKLFLDKGRGDFYPPLFILGVPRSGTTLVYQAIIQQFRVGYFNRAINYIYGMPNLLMRLMRLTAFVPLRPPPVFESHYGKVKGNLFAPAESGSFWFRWFPRDSENGNFVSRETFTKLRYQSLFDNIVSLSNIIGLPLVFKSVYLGMVIGILTQVFPQANFVFVKRDPLLTIQSLLKGRLRQKNPELWWSVKHPTYRESSRHPIWKQVTEQYFFTQHIVSRDLRKYAENRYITVTYSKFCQYPRQSLLDLSTLLAKSGYQTYPDMRVPESFTVSNKTTIDSELAEKIFSHLAILENEVRFESKDKE